MNSIGGWILANHVIVFAHVGNCWSSVMALQAEETVAVARRTWETCEHSTQIKFVLKGFRFKDWNVFAFTVLGVVLYQLSLLISSEYFNLG